MLKEWCLLDHMTTSIKPRASTAAFSHPTKKAARTSKEKVAPRTVYQWPVLSSLNTLKWSKDKKRNVTRNT